MNKNLVLFKIRNCLEEQRRIGEKDCRKDILAIKSGVDIEIINELIASGELFEEFRNGEERVTDIQPKKSGVKDREKLIRSLAHNIENHPRRSFQQPKQEGRDDEFLR